MGCADDVIGLAGSIPCDHVEAGWVWGCHGGGVLQRANSHRAVGSDRPT